MRRCRGGFRNPPLRVLCECNQECQCTYSLQQFIEDLDRITARYQDAGEDRRRGETAARRIGQESRLHRAAVQATWRQSLRPLHAAPRAAVSTSPRWSGGPATAPRRTTMTPGDLVGVVENELQETRFRAATTAARKATPNWRSTGVNHEPAGMVSTLIAAGRRHPRDAQRHAKKYRRSSCLRQRLGQLCNGCNSTSPKNQ